MKRLFLSIILISQFIYSQGTPRAGGINNSQATVLPAVHDNFTGVQSMNNNAFAVYDFATNFTYYLGLKIPANALVRIRTSTTGTGSVTYVTGQENY